ncbi:MAG: hypothetical protein OZ914_11200 [Anaerolineaceae bacterium]|nr:hypothetical protein [Anaerolineaceae bacterium]
MKHKFLLFSLALALVLSSCNLPLSAPTETPTPTFTDTPAPPTDTPQPTNTPLPTDTPLPTLTFTPSVPTATTLDKPVNCRLGPGTEWLVVSALNLGQSSQIVGKNSDTSWWLIQDPLATGRNCWVASSVTSASGNLSGLQIAQTPAATVTNVTIKLDPKLIDLGLLCIGVVPAVKFTGSIETNGPTNVKWHFETQQGGVQPDKTTEFGAFGIKEVSGEYTPVAPIVAGKYWVRLVVTSPNSLVAEALYEIDCT